MLGSLFPIVTVGLAFAAGERVRHAQAVGIAAALAGIVLVAVPVTTPRLSGAHRVPASGDPIQPIRRGS